MPWLPKTFTDYGGIYPTAKQGTLLQLVGNDPLFNTRFSIDNYGTAGLVGSALVGRTANGTPSSPLPVTADKVLLALGGQGYANTLFSNASNVSITFRAAKTFTDTDLETYIAFSNTSAGSTTNVEKMRLKSNGTLNLATLTTPGFIQNAANGDLFSTDLATTQASLGIVPGGGISTIKGTGVFNFGNENETVVLTIADVSITNSNFNSFTTVPQETAETSLDDFDLNGLSFKIQNIIDNTSFDLVANAANNATGNYTIKYIIIK